MSVTRTNKLLEKAQQGKAHMTKEIADLVAKNRKLTTKCEEQDVAIKMAGAELEEMKKAAETKEETGTLADMATAVPVE